MYNSINAIPIRGSWERRISIPRCAGREGEVREKDGEREKERERERETENAIHTDNTNKLAITRKKARFIEGAGGEGRGEGRANPWDW